MKIDLCNWPINDDAESELHCWLKELTASLRLGAIFALLTGVVITFLPKGGGHPGGELAGMFWTYLVEIAFWLGMLLGLLWGASKRLGAALSASLPWQPPRSEREATGRFFGQWAALAAVLGFFLWLAHQLALAAGLPEMAALLVAFPPVEVACALTAALFAAVALARRPYSRHQRQEIERPLGRYYSD
jgi:hypothetical protein